jgi:hypothetical protein
LLLLIVPAGVDAGQPLVTDDAAIVADKTCQLEAWARPSHDQRSYWLQPACNFGGNVEVSAGAARVETDGDAVSSLVYMQLKTVPFPRTENGWSFGALAGAVRDTGAPHGGSAFQGYYAKALASWYPREDLEFDLNLGAANQYGIGTFALAGAAVQVAVLDRLQLLAEVYRDEPGTAKYQAGLRWIALPDRLEAFVSYGNRFTRSADQWIVTTGVRLQSPAFLP